MSNRVFYFSILVSLIFSSCKVHEQFLNEAYIKSDSTYKQLNQIIGQMLPIPPDLSHVTQSKKVYKLTFTEQYFANNGILQRATLPSQTKAKTETYLGFMGHSEVLYLVKLTDTIFTQNRNDFELFTTFIFYSLKLDANGACIGYNPVRIGSMRKEKKSNNSDEMIDVISFRYDIKLVNDKATRKPRPLMSRAEKRQLFYKPNAYSYQLKATKLVKSDSPVLFILDENTDQSIKLAKVLAQYPNKVGGKDYLVYDLREVMPDKDVLKFNILK
jgi:hypothetical protein